MKNITFAASIGFAAAGLFAQQPPPAAAPKFAEFSFETRFQLDLHVPDAVLAAFLPDKWTSSVAVQGPAKDCNLRAVFIDRVTINGPDGKPLGKGSNRLVYDAALDFLERRRADHRFSGLGDVRRDGRASRTAC
jgi:hypothetical protein